MLQFSYLKLFVFDDYHVSSIALHVITGLLLNDVYHLWEFAYDWLLIKYWFQFWLMI